MGWANKYRMVGQPIITKDKPGAALEKVLDEIQDKAITKIEGSSDSEGYGTGERHVVNIKVTGSANTATIRGEVFLTPGDVLPKGSEQYQVLSWDGSKWIADFVRAT